MIHYDKVVSVFSAFYGAENTDFQFDSSKDRWNIIVKYPKFTLYDDTENSVEIDHLYIKFKFDTYSGDKHNIISHHFLSLTRTQIDGHEYSWGGFHPHSNGRMETPSWHRLCEGTQLRNARMLFNSVLDEDSLFMYLHYVDAFVKFENTKGTPYRYIKNLILSRNIDDSSTDGKKYKLLTHDVANQIPKSLFEQGELFKEGLTSELLKTIDNLHEEEKEEFLTILCTKLKNLFDSGKPVSHAGISIDTLKDLVTTISFKDAFKIKVDLDKKLPRLEIIDRHLASLVCFLSEILTVVQSNLHKYIPFSERSIENLFERSFSQKDYFSMLCANVVNRYRTTNDISIEPSRHSSFREPESPFTIPHVFSFKDTIMNYSVVKYEKPKKTVSNNLIHNHELSETIPPISEKLEHWFIRQFEYDVCNSKKLRERESI